MCKSISTWYLLTRLHNPESDMDIRWMDMTCISVTHALWACKVCFNIMSVLTFSIRVNK